MTSRARSRCDDAEGTGKDPADRYQTAAEMKADIDSVLSGHAPGQPHSWNRSPSLGHRLLEAATSYGAPIQTHLLATTIVLLV